MENLTFEECKKRLDEAKQVIVKKVDENGESNF